jgi:hypothetical protein
MLHNKYPMAIQKKNKIPYGKLKEKEENDKKLKFNPQTQ